MDEEEQKEKNVANCSDVRSGTLSFFGHHYASSSGSNR